ncbi:MAG: hypothetical protein ABWY51_10690 [Gaiellaceae bacterium]
MLYRLVVGLIAAVGLLVVAMPALAGPPETTNMIQKNVVETFVDVLPTCEGGPPYTVTSTTNFVEHQTVFADGRVPATFTQTGKVVAVPLEDPSLPSYTGQVTIWGGFNANGTTANGTFTFNVRLVGSDGSTVTNHQVDHFNVRPDGSVNEFFHCH